MNNKSPLRYPGGKTRACQIIERTLLEHNVDISKFKFLASPFFGGGSFEFYLQNKYELQIKANDKFKPLYNFWTILQKEKDLLCARIRFRLNTTKKKFVKYRREIMELDDPGKQAVYYFVINRCSFSGATLSGGFSKEASKKRFTESSIQRLSEVNLSQVTFSNLDFKDFLDNVQDTDLLFLDPPYYLESKSKLYGNKGDLHESFDHQGLLMCLKQHKNWILCYNNCQKIKKMYKDYTIVDVNWSYGMNTNKESSEILILNF